MAASEPLPNVVLVGGAGVRSGVPRHLQHLCNSLSGTARVTVVSDRDEGGYDWLSGGAATHVVIDGLATRLSPGHLWRGTRGLFELLRNCPADLIWFHARLPVLLGRLLLACRVWRPAAKVACTFHGLPFDQGHRPVARHISLWLEKLLLACCPSLHLVFLTEAMRDRMRAAVGARCLARHHLHVLENASDLGPLPDPARSNGRHLVMTGRVSWQKNMEQAATLLAHLPSDVTLSLCGPGTERPAFCDRIAALVPPDVFARIRFVGPLADVRDILSAADAYLLTSRYEGTPIGALEALEAGLPIILRDFEGARTLTDRHPHALCLRLETPAQDAAGIIELLNTVREQGPEAHLAIRAAWAAHWSMARFGPAARALVNRVLLPPDPVPE